MNKFIFSAIVLALSIPTIAFADSAISASGAATTGSAISTTQKAADAIKQAGTALDQAAAGADTGRKALDSITAPIGLAKDTAANAADSNAQLAKKAEALDGEDSESAAR